MSRYVALLERISPCCVTLAYWTSSRETKAASTPREKRNPVRARAGLHAGVPLLCIGGEGGHQVSINPSKRGPMGSQRNSQRVGGFGVEGTAR